MVVHLFGQKRTAEVVAPVPDVVRPREYLDMSTNSLAMEPLKEDWHSARSIVVFGWILFSKVINGFAAGGGGVGGILTLLMLAVLATCAVGNPTPTPTPTPLPF
jgi:hypothetical protein